MGNGVSTDQGNLPPHDKRDVGNGSADREQYDWSEQAEAPETNTLLADHKSYSLYIISICMSKCRINTESECRLYTMSCYSLAKYF